MTLYLFHSSKSREGGSRRPRECFLPRLFEAFLPESATGAPLPVRAPRASRHERRTWADRPHNRDRKLPLLLILAGHEAHGGAMTSGGEDHVKPHRAKIVLAHGCTARKHSAETAEAARLLIVAVLTRPRGALYYLLFLRRKRRKPKWARLVLHQPTARVRATLGAQADPSSRFTGERRRADLLPSPRQAR